MTKMEPFFSDLKVKQTILLQTIHQSKDNFSVHFLSLTENIKVIVNVYCDGKSEKIK